jgi:transposase
MWPIRTTDQKEESMGAISQKQIIGIDVSRDWLDIHCLPDGHRLRIANTARGHEQLVKIAHDRRALVCFEGCKDQKLIQ